MRLLGERNWYLPGWLAWLPALQVEGHPSPKAETDAAHEHRPAIGVGA
jgi:RND superfamily putative drug exporter